MNNRAAVFAWILVGLLVVAAVVAVAAKPVHWERTAGLAALLAVIAAVLAVRYSRVSRAPSGRGGPPAPR